MVKILADGEIVADDDPRVQQAAQRQNVDRMPGQARFQSAGQFQQGPGAQGNIFETLNQRLVAIGIPSFNIGDIVIQPIVTIGLLLAMLMFGINGLILGLILFAVCRWSTHGPPEFVSRFFGGGNNGNQRGAGNQRGTGNGYRLGR